MHTSWYAMCVAMRLNVRREMMTNFDPNKTYTIGVWDMTYYVYDDEADDYVRNADGSVKEFCASHIDYSYMADGIDVDDLEEITDE